MVWNTCILFSLCLQCLARAWHTGGFSPYFLTLMSDEPCLVRDSFSNCVKSKGFGIKHDSKSQLALGLCDIVSSLVKKGRLCVGASMENKLRECQQVFLSHEAGVSRLSAEEQRSLFLLSEGSMLLDLLLTHVAQNGDCIK